MTTKLSETGHQWFGGKPVGLILSKPIPSRQSQSPASAEKRHDEKPNQEGAKPKTDDC